MTLFPWMATRYINSGNAAYGTKRYNEAANYYRKAAELGSPVGQRKLGKMYQYGYGVEVDHVQAVNWYRKAAEQADAAALRLLGNMYYYGHGVDEDYKTATSLYSRSAMSGDAAGQYSIGYMYENGYGMPLNLAAAVRWYRESANQGSSLGQNALANMYRYGKGVAMNKAEALRLYRLAAEQGNETALNNMHELQAELSGKVNENNDTSDSSAGYKLDQMIGLAKVKEEVSRMFGLAKIQKVREENSMKAIPVSKHLVFIGNPGTGKTTVARILGQKYKEIGILSTGQLVEVSRADLVAGYVGQTAIKTKKKINEALGGILFIDEAYTLANGAMNDFGQEAIDTLIKEMEDHRDELIVIVAGYPDLMEDFISSNPGLKSRFSKSIFFEDYSADELIAIFHNMCREHGLILSADAAAKAEHHIRLMEQNKGYDFANARDVRNFFERIYSNQALRLASKPSFNLNEVLSVEAEDIDEFNNEV